MLYLQLRRRLRQKYLASSSLTSLAKLNLCVKRDSGLLHGLLLPQVDVVNRLSFADRFRYRRIRRHHEICLYAVRGALTHVRGCRVAFGNPKADSAFAQVKLGMTLRFQLGLTSNITWRSLVPSLSRAVVMAC